jgi:hypothetical protein
MPFFYGWLGHWQQRNCLGRDPVPSRSVTDDDLLAHESSEKRAFKQFDVSIRVEERAGVTHVAHA